MKDALSAAGAAAETVGCTLSAVTAKDGTPLMPDKDFTTAPSLVYDAVYIPGGAQHVDALGKNIDARNFINEATLHKKTVAATGEAVEFLRTTDAGPLLSNLPDAAQTAWVNQGIVIAKDAAPGLLAEFVNQLSMHRHWGRPK